MNYEIFRTQQSHWGKNIAYAWNKVESEICGWDEEKSICLHQNPSETNLNFESSSLELLYPTKISTSFFCLENIWASLASRHRVKKINMIKNKKAAEKHTAC